ncbi:MAG: gyrase, subunit [Chloroflexi bacterium]|jgi:DNA gyrase subunit A|nr:gyrase, subunit [Chloroflexota bacterium]
MEIGDNGNLGNIRVVDIDQEMRTAYLDYAMSVIVQRALPDVRDGLKPVQRRILYSMSENNYRFNGPYRKSARIVGDVMGKYHPHGDSSIYETMVRMAQDFSLRYLLIDGQGNFGSIEDDPAAASRYTEARMTPIADELLQDLDKDTVDFVPNYDGSEQQPSALPAKLPNLLLNGAQGIAVGMATNIPPHNLTEICDVLIYLVDNPDATVDELIQYLPGPDFPTGGIILGRDGIKEAYSTGRGRIIVRAKAHVEENRGRFSIIVTELPYQVSMRTLQERIAELVKDGKLDGISDMNNESDRTGIRLVIDLKRDAQPKKVLNQLFKYTQLQTSFSCNLLALVENGMEPKLLTLRRILREHIAWRQLVISRRTRFDLDKARRRAHILEGLLRAIDQIDAIINSIRQSKSRDAARTSLMEGFQLSEEQSIAILEMQLGRLAALERQRIDDEFTEIRKNINYLEDLLAHPEKILGLIKDDLKMLRDKFGDARRTTIMAGVESDFSVEDLIPDELILVTVTNKGYIKRLAHDTYKTQRRGGKGITGMTTREEDAIKHTIICSTLDSLLFFTNKGRVFQLKAHEIPDSGRTTKGLPIINLISLTQNETITSVLPVSGFAKSEYLIMATRNGKIKRTNLGDFASVRANGLIAIRLEDNDELSFVWETSGNGEVIMTTAEGKTIRFRETEVRPMGRDTVGVNAIRLVNSNDHVVGMDLVDPGADLLIITSNGIGKRTPLEEFPTHGRYGQGVIAMRISDKSGQIVATRVVKGNDEIMLMTTSGMVTRIAAHDVSQQGRSTSGVMVMTFKEGKGDSVASVAVVREEQAAAAMVRGKGTELDSLRLPIDSKGHVLTAPNGNGHTSADELNPVESSDFVDLIEGDPSNNPDLEDDENDNVNGNGNGHKPLA